MKKIPDLNCDLGEHEAPSITLALMKQVTSVNIACGGHAGNLESMQRCLRLAKKYQVRAGAHPGLPDKNGFGRGDQAITPAEFKVLLCSQISCLETLAKKEGLRLRHVKLHGALYHMVEKDAQLGKAYLECIAIWWPKLAIRSVAGGEIFRAAVKKGLPVSPELFADRSYSAPLELVPRTHPGAVLTDPVQITSQVLHYLQNGTWPLSSGATFRPEAATLCVHGDTFGSVNLLQKLKKLLR